jgi:hypothetical protein
MLTGAIFVGQAEAGPTWATHVGGTCVPDSKTIHLGLYETAGFGVRFSGASVGKIRLLCPFGLDTYDAKLGSIVMSFIDTDGGHVLATLGRAHHGTNVAVTLGTCDSNASKLPPSSATGPQEMVCKLFSLFTTSSKDWYWWEILIERSIPTVNVEFLGVSLLYSP